MATFGELKEAIRRALVRADEFNTDGNAALTDSTIEYYIRKAVDFYKGKRLYFNEKRNTAFSLSSDITAIPTDLFKVISWRITTSGKERILINRNYEIIENLRSVNTTTLTDTPRFYAIYNSNFHTVENPSTTLTTTLSYIYEIADFADDNSSNAWSTIAENLIRVKAQEYIYRESLHDTTRANDFAVQARVEYQKIRERSGNLIASDKVLYETYM